MGCGGSKDKDEKYASNQKREVVPEGVITDEASQLVAMPWSIQILGHAGMEFVEMSDDHYERMKEKFPGERGLYRFMLSKDAAIDLTMQFVGNGGALKENRFTWTVVLPRGFLADGASGFIPFTEVNVARQNVFTTGWWLHDFMYQTSKVTKDVPSGSAKLVKWSYEFMKKHPKEPGHLVTMHGINLPPGESSEIARDAVDTLLGAWTRQVLSSMVGKKFFGSNNWGIAVPRGSNVDLKKDPHASNISFDDVMEHAKQKFIVQPRAPDPRILQVSQPMSVMPRPAESGAAYRARGVFGEVHAEGIADKISSALEKVFGQAERSIVVKATQLTVSGIVPTADDVTIAVPVGFTVEHIAEEDEDRSTLTKIQDSLGNMANAVGIDSTASDKSKLALHSYLYQTATPNPNVPQGSFLFEPIHLSYGTVMQRIVFNPADREATRTAIDSLLPPGYKTNRRKERFASGEWAIVTDAPVNGAHFISASGD